MQTVATPQAKVKAKVGTSDAPSITKVMVLDVAKGTGVGYLVGAGYLRGVVAMERVVTALYRLSWR